MSLLRSHFDNKKYTYTYFCQDNVCRLCWSTNNSITSAENDSKMGEKIMEYLGIDITMGTPNKACNVCISQIKKITNFVQWCQEGERKLKIIISNAFEENCEDPIVLGNEADLELKLLAQEMNYENFSKLLVKEEDCNFEIANLVTDYDDLIPNFEYTDPRSSLFPRKNNFRHSKYDNLIPIYKNFADLLPKGDDLVLKGDDIFPKGDDILLRADDLHPKVEDLGDLFCNDHNLPPVDDNKLLKDSNCVICSLKRDMINHKAWSCIVKKYTYYECCGCKRVFLSFDRKIDHELRACKAIKRFKCNAHKKKELEVNKGKPKGVCEICGKSRKHLTIHKATHTPKQFKCPHCDYCAVLQASLKTHIKSHTGERPYVCDKCPYRCITKSNLNKHLKTHTDEKEYQCHICNKRYRYKTSLRDHVKMGHEGEKKHKCKECGVQYCYVRDLRKHMLKKHGLKLKSTWMKLKKINDEG